MMRFSLVSLLGLSLLSAGCSLIGGNDDDEGLDATFTASTFSYQVIGEPLVELGDEVTFSGSGQRSLRENRGASLFLSFVSNGAKAQVPQRKEINTSIFIAIPLGPDGTLQSCASCQGGANAELDADFFYRSSVSTDSMEVIEQFSFRGLELNLEDFEISDTVLRGAYRLKVEQTEGTRRRLVFLEDGQTRLEIEQVNLTTDGTLIVEGNFSFRSREVIVRYDKAAP